MASQEEDPHLAEALRRSLQETNRDQYLLAEALARSLETRDSDLARSMQTEIDRYEQQLLTEQNGRTRKQPPWQTVHSKHRSHCSNSSKLAHHFSQTSCSHRTPITRTPPRARSPARCPSPKTPPLSKIPPTYTVVRKQIIRQSPPPFSMSARKPPTTLSPVPGNRSQVIQRNAVPKNIPAPIAVRPQTTKPRSVQPLRLRQCDDVFGSMAIEPPGGMARVVAESVLDSLDCLGPLPPSMSEPLSASTSPVRSPLPAARRVTQFSNPYDTLLAMGNENVVAGDPRLAKVSSGDAQLRDIVLPSSVWKLSAAGPSCVSGKLSKAQSSRSGAKTLLASQPAQSSTTAHLFKALASKPVQTQGNVESRGQPRTFTPVQLPSAPQLDAAQPQIVIDGQNVARHYSLNHQFVSKGVKLVLDYYFGRGIPAVALLPRCLVDTRSSSPRGRIADDVPLLLALEEIGRVCFVPAGTHDDYFILKYAMNKDIDIISNDRFEKEISAQETSEQAGRLQKFLRRHLIPFMFIHDDFVPNPDGCNIGSAMHHSRIHRGRGRKY